jgi:hypothetical protein
MLKHFTAAYAVILALLLSPSVLTAQDTPSNQGSEPTAIQSQADQPTAPGTPQSTAPATPTPATDQPTRVEKIRQRVEANPIVQRLQDSEGFYPRIGGLTQGSGFAAGGGYRKHLGWAYIELSAAYSTKHYSGADAGMRWLQTAHKSFEIWTNLSFRNDTQDDFYGRGPGSTNADRVDFGIQSTDVAALALEHIRSWFTVGADIGYFVPEMREGEDDRQTTIGNLYTEATAPGLARQPRFIHDSVFATIDSRDAAGFPTRGGFFRTSYARWRDQTLHEFDFQRFDIEHSQFFAVATDDVIALRLNLSYTNNAPGEQIPFYMLPYLGGGDTVRSYREFRFRDENMGFFNTEFRHRVSKMAYLAAFVDVGKVAHNWQDINPTDRNLKTAYGLGLRIGSDKRTFLRLDTAYGDEGTRVFLKFSPAF